MVASSGNHDLKSDLPFFLSLNIQQSAKRSHHLWYVKCAPTTVLHYAIYSVLMGLAEIFHYYSVSCFYSPCDFV